MPITLDELIESAASGVLRAMNARAAGEKNGSDALTQRVDPASLVQAGFNVDFHIRAGGIPPFLAASTITAALNPQPLPPYREN